MIILRPGSLIDGKLLNISEMSKAFANFLTCHVLNVLILMHLGLLRRILA